MARGCRTVMTKFGKFFNSLEETSSPSHNKISTYLKYSLSLSPSPQQRNILTITEITSTTQTKAQLTPPEKNNQPPPEKNH